MTVRRGTGLLAARVAVAVAAVAGLTLAGNAGASAASAVTATAPAVLESLACPSASHCVAVGADSPDRPTRLAADNWNGTAWVRVAVPSPAGSVSVNLNGVGCPAVHPCVAVGRAYPKSGGFYAIGAVWNGASWSVARAVDPGSSSDLFAVSCATTASCFAVGRYTRTGSASWTALIEHWNGKAWAELAAPVPAGSNHAALQAVSCAAWNMCVAAGGDDSGQLIERWNGHVWAATRPPTRTSETLLGVSCPTATSCFASGGDKLSQGSLIDHWNGRTWTRDYPVTAADADYPMFKSVSCSSPSACLAVGNNVAGAFVDRWDGTDWLPVGPLVFNGGTPRYFVQVRCLSATNCVALASANPASDFWRSSAEFWNGTSFQTVPTT